MCDRCPSELPVKLYKSWQLSTTLCLSCALDTGLADREDHELWEEFELGEIAQPGELA